MRRVLFTKWLLTFVAGLAPLVVAAWSPPPVASRLVDVEIVDRSDGQPLPVYRHDGRSWIVGTPGHEYTVRLRNLTPARVLAVTSVDGVNVITGDTASPSQS